MGILRIQSFFGLFESMAGIYACCCTYFMGFCKLLIYLDALNYVQQALSYEAEFIRSFRNDFGQYMPNRRSTNAVTINIKEKINNINA